MKNEQTIREAISRSISHTERVRVEIEADDIHELVGTTYLGEWDYTTENDGSLDVFSIDDRNGNDWRLNVTVVA